MATGYPTPQQQRRSDAALALMLVFGNLVFGGCVAWRWAGGPAPLANPAAATVSLALLDH